MADVLANVLGITIFVLLIAASIALHEWGHFATARRFGAKVTEFMVGFGPLLWGRRKGEVTYGLKAVPVGGYVRIVGMFPPPQDAPAGMERTGTTGRFAGIIEQARADALAEVGPDDADRVFYKLPVHQRIIVMLAGPFMNLFLAIGLFAIALSGIGLPQATTTIAEVVPCIVTAQNPTGSTAADGSCPTGGPSPASDADIRPGDVVVAVNGEAVDDWEALTGELGAVGPGSAAELALERDGGTTTTTLVVGEAVFPVVGTDGQATGEVETRAFIGIRPAAEFVPLPLSQVPGYMWDITVRSVQALVTLPVRLWELTTTLVTGGERDPEGPVSVVGVSRLGGEIAATDQPFAAKAAAFLGLAASLNLFLFLFNLLPLLPLDGGHVAAASYEGVRRRWARRRGAPDPGPVDTAKLLPLTYGVAAVLLVSGIIVIWADIVAPISL
jgi:membrane-associated protease RseP (regulator of RpoE activity)